MSDNVTALAIRRPMELKPTGGYQPPPDKAELTAMVDLANYLAKAEGIIPKHFSGQPYKILAAVLYGRDLGITPTNALQHIIVIDGKAGADAQLIGMLVRRAGHILGDVTTNEKSTVTIKRGDTGEVFTATFGREDAERITIKTQDGYKKLASQPAYQNYPRGMYYSRALTECARKACQDALMGIAYTPEELDAGAPVGTATLIDGGGEHVLSAPAPGEPVGNAETAPVQAPPAPPEQAEVTAGASPDQPAVGGTESEASAPAPAPSAAPVMPLSGPALGRRMGAGRSIGPAPRRTNVVTVEQAPETPATASEPAPAPVPQPDAVPSQPAPAALTDEPVLPPVPEPVDPGKQVFLNDMRGDLRVQTAKLFRVNALISNHMADLGVAGKDGKVPQRADVPPPTPNEASDKALTQRIDADYPGRRLENLGETELGALMERFESNLAAKRKVLSERGIHEE